MTPEEQAELIVKTCERFMRGYLRELPEIVQLQQQARALFPYHQDSDGGMVFGPSVLDRLTRVEEKIGALLERLEVF